MPQASDYTYSVAWDGNEIQFWAQVKEFPSLSFFANTEEEALGGLHSLVSDILTDMTATGEKPPLPKSAT